MTRVREKVLTPITAQGNHDGGSTEGNEHLLKTMFCTLTLSKNMVKKRWLLGNPLALPSGFPGQDKEPKNRGDTIKKQKGYDGLAGLGWVG